MAGPGNLRPGSLAPPTAPNYNPIFERFVPPGEHDDRLSGLVAYGLYKVAKREWAAGIWATEGRGPSEQERRDYIRTWTPSRLDGLQDQADNVLASFSETVVQVARPDIREDALRGTTRSAILTGMAGNFCYTLVLIAAVILLAWSGVDLAGLLEKLKPPR